MTPIKYPCLDATDSLRLVAHLRAAINIIRESKDPLKPQERRLQDQLEELRRNVLLHAAQLNQEDGGEF